MVHGARHLAYHAAGPLKSSVADRTGLSRLAALTGLTALAVGLLVLRSLGDLVGGGLTVLPLLCLARLLPVRGLLGRTGGHLLAGDLAVAGALRCYWLARLLPVRGLLSLHRVPGHLSVALLLGRSRSLGSLSGRHLLANVLGDQVGEALGQDVIDEGHEEQEDGDRDDEQPQGVLALPGT